MLFLNSVRVAPGVRSALAVACGLALSGAGMAQAQDGVEPVVVTASRMPQLLQTAPIGATVITAEQIQRSGVADVNEAIRKLAGVAATSDLSNGRENVLDLRGFGATASQNVVVLLDGIRLSENEGVAARLTAIPLALVDRIEIVRGGSSVQWGEGASSGVINVILKSGQSDISRARIGAAVESFGGQELQADGQWGLGPVALDASFKRVRSDGFRDNGGYKQDVVALGVQWQQAAWRGGLRLMQEAEASRLPGSLLYSAFKANPRATTTPQDEASNQEMRLLGNLAHQWGAWSLQMDAGYRERQPSYQYVSFGSPRVVGHTTQNQFTPRLVYASALWGADVKALMGLDWQQWSFDKTGSDGLETGSQNNHAFFVQTDVHLPTKTRVSVGWREERVRKQGDFPGDAAFFMAPVNYDRRDKLHAGEFGLSQTVAPGWDVYGRLASSYRLANVDDNRTTPSAGPLLPQQNADRELGVKWMRGGDGATVRLFRQKTINEIAFDNVLYANTNLDPTRRAGTEIEGHWSPVKALTLAATWQQLTARFRAGANTGKEMTQVAPHTATARATYRVNEQHTLELGMQYLSSSRYVGDEDNMCSMRVPSSTLLDARYAWTDRVWTIALSGTNLADKKGFNYGSTYLCGEPYVYPYAGRSVKLSASRQF